MGVSCSRPAKLTLDDGRSTTVTLNIYDLGTSGNGTTWNRLLAGFGVGAFHCGVEIYDLEWSYADVMPAPGRKRLETPVTGVFVSWPRACEGHTYSQSVSMGDTQTSQMELMKVIQTLQKEWPAHKYDLVKSNCCHFCNELCQRLRVGSIPEWVNKLAGAGAAARKNAWEVSDLKCCQTISSEIWRGELQQQRCCDQREDAEVEEDRSVSLGMDPRTAQGEDIRYLM